MDLRQIRGLQNSRNFQSWKLAMGINGNLWESMGIYGNKPGIYKIEGWLLTGDLNIVGGKIYFSIILTNTTRFHASICYSSITLAHCLLQG